MSRLSVEQEARVLAVYSEARSTSHVKTRTGHSLETVKRVLARHGIHHEIARARKLSDLDVRSAIDRQRKGESVEAIARDIGVRGPALRRRMRLLGHEPTDSRRNRADRHHNWTGGRIKVGGYIRVRVEPDDPMLSTADDRGYVLEHRLVVARALGRPLTASETVHHINGRKADNRLENLQLCRGRHGNGVALRCAECGSRDLVEVGL